MVAPLLNIKNIKIAKITYFKTKIINTMKKNFNFLLFSVLCLVAFTLSSCFKVSEDSDTTYPLVARVDYSSGTLTLVDSIGNAYVPTSSSFTSDGTTYTITSANDGDLAYIGFKYNSGSSSASSSSSSISTCSITLTYFADIETTFHNSIINTTKGASNDSVNKIKAANDSLFSVDYISMLGKHLVVSLNYYLGTIGSSNTSLGSPKLNYNTVVFYTDQELSKSSSISVPDTLKLWLCHHSIGSLSYTTYYWAYYYPYFYYYGYNLKEALAYASDKSTKDSVVVDFKAKIATNSGSAVWKDFCCKAEIH